VELLDYYLLTSRQLKISILGVNILMECIPLFVVVAFGYHFSFFITGLVIHQRQSLSVFSQPVGLLIAHNVAMRLNPLDNHTSSFFSVMLVSVSCNSCNHVFLFVDKAFMTEWTVIPSTPFPSKISATYPQTPLARLSDPTCTFKNIHRILKYICVVSFIFVIKINYQKYKYDLL
jgi:hypothetical protein